MKGLNYFKHLLPAIIILFAGLLSYGQSTQLTFEGFENGEIPVGWGILDENDDALTWKSYNGSYANTGEYYAGVPGFITETANDDYLILPKLLPSAEYPTVSFWGKSTDYAPETVEVLLSTTGAQPADFTIELAVLDPMPTIYTEYEYDLTDYIGQEVFFAIRYVAPADQNIPCIDDITFPKYVSSTDAGIGLMYAENDLIIDFPNELLVPVVNEGASAISEFTIHCYNEVDGDDELLATVNQFVTLSAGETMHVPFEVTFADTGMYNLYTVVEVEGDMTVENNTSTVQEFHVGEDINVLVGVPMDWDSGDTPSSFFHRNSLTQTIFYADELNVYPGMTLNEFTLFLGNGLENSGTQVLTMWMGETTRDSLSDGEGWIDVNELTEVFNGSITIPPGNHEIPIEIDPYLYTGQNLVLMVSKVDNGNVPYAGWRVQTTERTGRAIHYLNHDFAADPYNPPALINCEISAQIPKTLFTFEYIPGNNGSLEGVVSDGTNPIEGVSITVDELGFQTNSNGIGEYAFDYMPAGTYTISASRDGYVPTTVADVVVGSDGVTTQDIVMESVESYPVDLTGFVYDEETQEPIEGVMINAASGLFNGVGMSQADGSYTIVGLPGYQHYELNFTKEGYESTEAEITVEAENATLEDAYMVYMYAEVTVEVSTNEVGEDNVEGAELTLSHMENATAVYTATVPADGVIVFDEVLKGDYEIEVIHAAFNTYTEGDIAIQTATTIEVVLMETRVAPIDLAAEDIAQGTVLFTWDHESASDRSFVSFDVFLNGSLVETVFDMHYEFTNLNYQTTYSMGVRAKYTSGYSSTQTITHTFLWDNVNNELVQDITIYPNPTSDNIYVKVPNKCDLVISDLSGREVMNLEDVTNTTQIQLQTLENGVYFIRFFIADSQITKKIIIQ